MCFILWRSRWWKLSLASKSAALYISRQQVHKPIKECFKFQKIIPKQRCLQSRLYWLLPRKSFTPSCTEYSVRHVTDRRKWSGHGHSDSNATTSNSIANCQPLLRKPPAFDTAAVCQQEYLTDIVTTPAHNSTERPTDVFINKKKSLFEDRQKK